MTRRFLLPLSAALLVAACGDAGLTVQGSVTVTSSDSTVRRFDFSNETRLDGSSPGRFTGTCRVHRTLDDAGNEQWGAVVDIRSGGTAEGDDTPFTSISVMQNTGAAPDAGRVEIELGGIDYTPVEGQCSVEIPYAIDGVVGLTGACRVASAANESVQVELDLDLAGCTVEG